MHNQNGNISSMLESLGDTCRVSLHHLCRCNGTLGSIQAGLHKHQLVSGEDGGILFLQSKWCILYFPCRKEMVEQMTGNERVLIGRGIGRWDRGGSRNGLLDDDDELGK